MYTPLELVSVCTQTMPTEKYDKHSKNCGRTAGVTTVQNWNYIWLGIVVKCDIAQGCQHPGQK